MDTLFPDLPTAVHHDEARLRAVVPPRHDDAPETLTRGGERGRIDPARADALLEGLNPAQREAVLHAGSPLLIVAGAGSGKTRVLAHRIAHKLATGQVRAGQVLVDEYQDTNHAQYILVRELVGPVGGEPVPGELTVVGDADQSIYAFRGATIRNILEFEVDYPAARTILLEQNYRSTQNILSAANAVISRNPGRKPKRLWTAAGAGPQIVGYVADNEHEEARFVAEEIDRLTDAEGVRLSEVAVFYRTNAQSRALEEVLIRVGLPYKVVGGTRFYDRVLDLPALVEPGA